MYKLAKGWTKEKVMEQFRKYNNGTMCKDLLGCVYLSKGGPPNRCAIGAFIPDRHPGLSYVGSVGALLDRHPELASLMPFDNIPALSAMQRVHDTGLSTENTHEKMQRFLDEEVE